MMSPAKDEAILDLAKIMYETYGKASDWLNYQKQPMPQWDSLPPKTVENWRMVAIKIAGMADQGKLNIFISSVDW